MSSSITRTRIESLLSAPDRDRGQRRGIGERCLQRRQHQLQPVPLGGVAQPPRLGDRASSRAPRPKPASARPRATWKSAQGNGSGRV
jgi:hypothetical protein